MNELFAHAATVAIWTGFFYTLFRLLWSFRASFKVHGQKRWSWRHGVITGFSVFIANGLTSTLTIMMRHGRTDGIAWLALMPVVWAGACWWLMNREDAIKRAVPMHPAMKPRVRVPTVTRNPLGHHGKDG